MEKENRFLKDLGKALLGVVPATRVGASMFTPEAQEAREDQSGLFPELGIGEGLRALRPSRDFGMFVGKAIAPPAIPFLAGLGSQEAQEAREDQSGFFPEFGITEAIKTANPFYDYTIDNDYEDGTGTSGRRIKGSDTYKQFIERTRNSPAMQSGAFDPKDLYKTYKANQQFKADRKSGKARKDRMAGDRIRIMMPMDME